jgi:hypothetical protein
MESSALVSPLVSRLEPKHAFCRDHSTQRPAIGHAAEQRQQQPAIFHRDNSPGGILRDQKLQHFHPHPLGGKAGEARASANAGENSIAIGLACAKGGVHAEEAENAQVILGNTLIRIADKAHALCGDIVESADVIVHRAV